MQTTLTRRIRHLPTKMNLLKNSLRLKPPATSGTRHTLTMILIATLYTIILAILKTIRTLKKTQVNWLVTR